MIEGIDPNVIVGWLAVLGVTMGALWKVGKWILEIRNDLSRALGILEKQQKQITDSDSRLTFVEKGLYYMAGKMGINLKEVLGE